MNYQFLSNKFLLIIADNLNDTNLVIDLIFLHPNSREIDNHQILPELQYTSDHTPLAIDISIEEEYVQDKCQIIIINSKKKANFLLELTKVISNIDTLHITDKDSLETIVQQYIRLYKSI